MALDTSHRDFLRSISVRYDRDGGVDSSLSSAFDIFRENGVCIVRGIYSPAECNALCDDIFGEFNRLSGGKLDFGSVDALRRTWVQANLPPQTRLGLFQALTAHFDATKRVRAHEDIERIFRYMYSRLRGKRVGDLVAAPISVVARPGCVGPFFYKSGSSSALNGRLATWAHLDQTEFDGSDADVFKCIQGQVVLTNTSASFRASVRSHRAYAKLHKMFGLGEMKKENWYKFGRGDYGVVRAEVEAVGGRFQVPIYAPAGSLILWTSTTIHSGKVQNAPHFRPFESDRRWEGYRCCVLVCLRPKDEFTKKQMRTYERAMREKRMTNHWCDRLFPKNTLARYFGADKFNETLRAHVANPTTAFAE